MEYIVDIKEVWNRSFRVKAHSREEAVAEAKRLVEAGEEELALEWSHELDSDTWCVYNTEKDELE